MDTQCSVGSGGAAHLLDRLAKSGAAMFAGLIQQGALLAGRRSEALGAQSNGMVADSV